jgi:hypothetical protein
MKRTKAPPVFTSKSGRLPDLSIKITPKAVIGIYENINERIQNSVKRLGNEDSSRLASISSYTLLRRHQQINYMRRSKNLNNNHCYCSNTF